MRNQIACSAEGQPGHWEAFCLDYDIAVHGDSFEAVFRDLNKAVVMYLETVAKLPKTEQVHLLNRRAPLGMRMKFIWYVLRHALTGRSGDGAMSRAEFTISCPA